MPITRRDFYKLALGSVVGLAVLKDNPTAVAQSISLKKPLPYGAGQKGKLQVVYHRKVRAVQWMILTIR
jgi:hypothetical protein